MCHVLVIEDEWLLAEYIADLAERAGATSIDRVDCEADAIDAADARRPDIILSDVMLPAGSGPHAVLTIIERNGPIPVIFITGTPDARELSSSPGVVLTKPVNEREVISTFRQLAPV